MIFAFDHARAAEVYDGDTFWVTIDLGLRMFTRQKVRLRKVRAAELKDEHGPEARALLSEFVPPGTWVKIVSHGWSYDRIEGDVTLPDGTDLGTTMLELLTEKGWVGGR